MEKDSDGKTALLIEGARRIGKSTIVESFGRNEYKSYIIIDFSIVSKIYVNCLRIFQIWIICFAVAAPIQSRSLWERVFDYFRRSTIMPPRKTGYQITCKRSPIWLYRNRFSDFYQKNVQDILIPSEERKLNMYPMDYEEFLWALNDETTIPLIHKLFDSQNPSEKRLIVNWCVISVFICLSGECRRQLMNISKPITSVRLMM